VGVVLGFFSLLYLQHHSAEPEAAKVGEPPPQPGRADSPAGGFAGVGALTSSNFTTAPFNTAQVTPPAEVEEPQQPWEIAINGLLDSDDENDKVAAGLAALVPSLPLEGQVEAVQHMVNLLDDERYELARNMLLKPALHPSLREVVFADALDRPNSVKLPVLLALLGSPGHPLRAEAHSNLQVLLGSDLGDNPAVWAGPVGEFLAREAEEDAVAEDALSEGAETGQ